MQLIMHLLVQLTVRQLVNLRPDLSIDHLTVGGGVQALTVGGTFWRIAKCIILRTELCFLASLLRRAVLTSPNLARRPLIGMLKLIICIHVMVWVAHRYINIHCD